MSLATRCASCGTVFRVVQDQLKVSEGWVRCGRCDSVFNALEGLFDLGRDEPASTAVVPVAAAASNPPPMSAMPPSAGTIAASGTTTAPGHVDIRTDREPDDDADRLNEDADDDALVPALWNEGPPSALDELLADPIDGHIFRERARADEVGARDRLEFSDARFDSDLFEDNAAPAEVAVAAPVTDAGALPLESAVRPEFVRRAERRAVWQSVPARLALSGASVLAVLVLMLQLGHHYRDLLGAQAPALRPVLAAWCGIAGCTLQPAHVIEDVVVDNTGLTRANGIDAFVLTVNLRNRAGIALAMPWVDLNLTDVNGRQIARRALAPRDFHAQDVLQPQAETALQLMLSAGGIRVAGYTVEIFYP